MARNGFDFEKPLMEIEDEIEALQAREEGEEPDGGGEETAKRLAELEKKKTALQKKIYANLSSWDRIQIARHNPC